MLGQITSKIKLGGQKMKFALHTLGCKVNQYETQAIETMLCERGHIEAGGEPADLIVVNTCAVTAESGRKSRQAIRHMKKKNPDAITVVCGCFSQLSPEDTKALGADIVFGSGDKLKLIEEIEKFATNHKAVLNIDDPFSRKKFEDLPAGAVEGRTRAMLKIQDGCVNFCTYCVIPYTRGRVRSLPIPEAIQRAKQLQDSGFPELVLTGIEIASYGKDLENDEDLCQIVCAIAEAVPNMRIRLGSLEPTIITEKFCQKLSEYRNICRHFHLSLQSGSDVTLAAMNRKYDTATFFEKTELLRKYFPNCGLTADLIAGFPQETETEHENTLAFIERCQFSSMHVFPYSIRPGTKASEMQGQLNRAEKSARAGAAQTLANEMELAFLKKQIGEVLPVIFETEHECVTQGHSDNYCQVEISGNIERGLVQNVKILTQKDKMLVGEII